MSKTDYSIYYSRFHDDSESHAKQMAEALVSILEPHAPDDRSTRVVDIGCGYGFALRALRKLGFNNLHGVEVSPDQARRSRQAGFEVSLVDDTVKWLNEQPGRFGFAVLLDVLEHVPVPVQIEFMQAVHRSLNASGKLVLTVPNANAILFGRWRYNDHTHYSSFTEHSLYYVLRNAGFESIQIDASKGIGRFPLRLWKRSS